ncbi:YceI family protein [Owenweeksia hongkongensis]|uniref:YceI family protein n=1 Tax=Owenweeksia hongkongensis TaxID=253245 RepID=UPI003A8EEBA7
MKYLGKFFAASAVLFAVACNNAPTETVETTEAEEVATPEVTEATYAVVTEGDEVKWEGFKTYSDGKHTGAIQVTEGQLMTEGGNVVGGSFVIDMKSITNDDLPEEGDYNQAKLIGHLSSADFFDVANHPTATFTITKVEAAAEGEATHKVSGNLNMRGTEKNITFPATINVEDEMVTLTTPEFVIDRTNWNVMYGSKNLESVAKDNLIDNNIKLIVDLKASKS